MRSRILGTKTIGIVAAIGCIMLGATLARGEVLAEDSFEDYDAGDLTGQGTAAGGWAGPWQNDGDPPETVVDVSANPLEAAGVSGGDQAIQASGYGWETNYRMLASTLEVSDGLYFGQLIRTDDSPDDCTVYDESGNHDHRSFGGVWYNGEVFGMNAGLGHHHEGGTVEANTDYLVVTYVTDSSAKLWVNPTSESDTPLLESTDAGFRPLDGIAFRTQTGMMRDRLIFGETFEDIVPPQAVAGDADRDGDVDSADQNNLLGGWTGAGGTGGTWETGDFDGDGDVDSKDQNDLLGNWTGAQAGVLGGDPGVADLIYDPATGNVKLDAGESPSGEILSFVLINDEDAFNAPGAASFPFIDTGTNTDDTVFQIGQSDALGKGFTGVHDLGDILPPGMTVAEVDALLTTADYVASLGGGTPRFDVVPEPATMGLLALGGLGALLRRRRF